MDETPSPPPPTPVETPLWRILVIFVLCAIVAGVTENCSTMFRIHLG